MHLWLALSPHGFGHAAMTAPLVTELRRRHPGLKLTIQTSLPRDFLETRYGRFVHVPEIPDIGFRMKSPTELDIEDSARFYSALHRDYDAVVAVEAARLAVAAPDLVLANVPYATIAGAAHAGIPVVAFSSLNWADMVSYYLVGQPGIAAIVEDIRQSYAHAAMFLRPHPAQPMSLPNVVDVGTVAALGRRRDDLLVRLGLRQGTKLGMIAYGGIDHRLPLEKWAPIAGWHWLANQPDIPPRPDMSHWRQLDLPYADISASVDLLITKSGYGTFSEAGLAGIPVLYEARPDWPEAPPLEAWLAKHTRCLAVTPEDLLERLQLLLHKLFSLPEQPLASPDGIVQSCDLIETVLNDGASVCMRS